MSHYDHFTPRHIIHKNYQRARSLSVSLASVAVFIGILLIVSVSAALSTSSDTITQQVAVADQSATGVMSVLEEESVVVPEQIDTASSADHLWVEERPTPTHLSIPKIDLEAGFVEPLGLTDTEMIEVPDSYENVGWYKLGPIPGDPGPAIILGHVDSFEGPAVLYDLKDLTVGDSIFVERSDGITTRFIVETLDTLSQDTFPVEAVYENLDYAALRIITCAGTYLEQEMRYTHNLVVTARLVGLDFEHSLELGNRPVSPVNIAEDGRPLN